MYYYSIWTLVEYRHSGLSTAIVPLCPPSISSSTAAGDSRTVNVAQLDFTETCSERLHVCTSSTRVIIPDKRLALQAEKFSLQLMRSRP
jgi:hypothetical protein